MIAATVGDREEHGTVVYRASDGRAVECFHDNGSASSNLVCLFDVAGSPVYEPMAALSAAGNWPHLIEVGTTLHLVWQEPIGPAANERGQVA